MEDYVNLMRMEMRSARANQVMKEIIVKKVNFDLFANKYIIAPFGIKTDLKDVDCKFKYLPIVGLCTPDYCKNGGNCYIENGEAACICQPGYIGEQCEMGKFQLSFLYQQSCYRN